MPRHDAEFRVYYEDTDAGGVMYHAKYLAFAERGRTEAMRSLGAPVSDLLDNFGLGFFVSALRIAYRRPVRLDELVRVTTWLQSLGGARCRLRQSITCEGTVAADLEVTLACIRVADNKPARIPPLWRGVLGGLVSDAAEQFVS
ncbi:YbgC/FadM family acyl-CoA thioesterase [Lichenicoccus sp.]|uniref:YbgC/FadM family acyl-CoA thioesterase n=1 Tax=Lichenicoccus sp. TaxID=2781899 RepID=UPI003D0BF694